MRIADTATMVCPVTGQALRWQGTNLELLLAEGNLESADGAQRWPVVDGLPRMVREGELRGTDRLSRHIHDRLPRAHRPVLRLGLPVLQGGGSEAALRRALIEGLRLGELAGGDPRPRLLEVGIGEGTNLPALRAALPEGLGAELWGVDLSEVLLKRCRERWRHQPFAEHSRLLVADAHRLPFPGGCFDRVFHMGGLGRFDDPARVLAELARVTRPGGLVVVVGKRLDRREAPAPAVQAAFRLLTVHEPEVDLEALPVPAGTVVEQAGQVSRFFAMLSLRREVEA
ncbi:class I SAM-dependent methyltransferase [Myxococcota bacterium]|nr:class I SAM-dependent methyltransferase [Myxococcota bacterium]